MTCGNAQSRSNFWLSHAGTSHRLSHHVRSPDTRLARMAAPAATPGYETSSDPYDPGSYLSAELIDGVTSATFKNLQLEILVQATRLPRTPADRTDRPPLRDRQRFAATATYRTYVNQG